jgi:hypothetical protein
MILNFCKNLCNKDDEESPAIYVIAILPHLRKFCDLQDPFNKAGIFRLLDEVFRMTTCRCKMLGMVDRIRYVEIEPIALFFPQSTTISHFLII